MEPSRERIARLINSNNILIFQKMVLGEFSSETINKII